MGVKTIKEKYDIKHMVQKVGENICIGSPYVHNIITITPEGKVANIWDRNSSNPDLRRYVEELEADVKTGELKKLFHQKDAFENILPIYTTEDGWVIKKYCEKYGYPNITTDGELMYENTFFVNYADALKYLKRDTF